MIEFFFDCSSPWTYLAFHNIQPLAKEFGVEISWRPILVGGIFNTVNPSVYASRETPVPAKARYMKKDLADWARSAGLAHQDAADGVSGEQRQGDARLHLARARTWCRSPPRCSRPIGATTRTSRKDEVLTEICKSVGVDPQKFLAGIAEQAIKDQLKANTDEVMARGGFGSPTIFVDKTDMYFGNDRLPLIREALAAPEGAGRLMPKAVVCRELGPPERLRLEKFAQRRWPPGRCASPSAPPASISPTY